MAIGGVSLVPWEQLAAPASPAIFFGQPKCPGQTISAHGFYRTRNRVALLRQSRKPRAEQL